MYVGSDSMASGTDGLTLRSLQSSLGGSEPHYPALESLIHFSDTHLVVTRCRLAGSHPQAVLTAR